MVPICSPVLAPIPHQLSSPLNPPSTYAAPAWGMMRTGSMTVCKKGHKGVRPWETELQQRKATERATHCL